MAGIAAKCEANWLKLAVSDSCGNFRKRLLSLSNELCAYPADLVRDSANASVEQLRVHTHELKDD